MPKIDVHAKCKTIADVDGRMVICSKSPEHIKSEAPEKREHFDHSADVRWTDADYPPINMLRRSR